MALLRGRLWGHDYYGDMLKGMPVFAGVLNCETEGGLLQNLVAYAHQLGHRGALTTELALNWAQVPPPANPLQRARRLVPCGTSRSFGPPSTPAHKSRCSWAMNRRPPRTITSNWTSK